MMNGKNGNGTFAGAEITILSNDPVLRQTNWINTLKAKLGPWSKDIELTNDDERNITIHIPGDPKSRRVQDTVQIIERYCVYTTANLYQNR